MNSQAAFRTKHHSEAELQALHLDLAASRTVGTTPFPAANLAEHFALYCRAYLICPTDPKAGEPFMLMPWQVAWVKAALADGITEAGLTCARRNGKTSLPAAILIATFLDPRSPLYVENKRGLVVSLQKSLSDEMRKYVGDMCVASGIRHRNRLDEISEVPNGNRINFVPGSKVQGQGRGVWLGVLDEAGLMFEDRRHLYDQFKAGIVGVGGRLLLVGTQSVGPVFRDVRLKAEASVPGCIFHAFEAPHLSVYAGQLERTRVEDLDALRAANPGLGVTVSESTLLTLAAQAAFSPADETAFRQWHLNEPLAEDSAALIELTAFDACTTTEDLPPRDGPCFVGLDFGGGASMTAAVAYWPKAGRLEPKGCFPKTPTLQQRGRGDSVGSLYLTARSTGELVQFGQHSTDVGGFVDWMRDVWLKDVNIELVGADRYKKADLLDALKGTTWQDVPLKWRGMGAGRRADGSYDIRATQKAFLDRAVRLAPSYLLTSGLAQSELRMDVAGNPALQKGDTVSKKRARIDVVSALVIAVGLAAKHYERLEEPA